jgi:hypothetical protein
MYVVSDILEKDGVNESRSEVVEIAQNFYETCLNDNYTGYQNIRKLIDDIVMEFDDNSTSLIPLLSKIRRELNGNYIFSMWIDVHLEDNSQNAIYVCTSIASLCTYFTSLKVFCNTQLDGSCKF